MSNGRAPRRRLSAAQSRMADTLGHLDGARIPGGCDDCDAYQTVRPMVAGAWSLTVHHDECCPTLSAIEARGHAS